MLSNLLTIIFGIAFAYTSIYFFVFLISGAIITGLYAKKRGSGMLFGFLLMTIGLLGSISGIPYWHDHFESIRIAKEHFKNTCAAKATIQLPETPKPSNGLVWLNPGAARMSYLSRGDDAREFVNPSRGLYQTIEVQDQNNGGFGSYSWSPDSYPGDLRLQTNVTTSSPSLEFAFTTVPITTKEDEAYGIEGIETTVQNIRTGNVIAKRVVFLKKGGINSTSGESIAVCPTGALDNSNCNIDGCSVTDFLLAAVPPTPTSTPSKAFHLYRGSGTNETYCGFEINIGPEISPEQIDVTIDSQHLSVRLKDTPDQIICSDISNVVSQITFTTGFKRIPLDHFIKEQIRDRVPSPPNYQPPIE